jgi:hypothetical protein
VVDPAGAAFLVVANVNNECKCVCMYVAWIGMGDRGKKMKRLSEVNRV